MWETKEPDPVKLIIGILAADADALAVARDAVAEQYGVVDMASDVWPFDMTEYYVDQTGEDILKQFVSFEQLINPEKIGDIKHTTNDIEKRLAGELGGSLPRPVNIDPGFIEPSKLVLATTKNFAHRIYIGNRMWAEVTLLYEKGKWLSLPYTFPDHKKESYQAFFSKVRARLVQQLREAK